VAAQAQGGIADAHVPQGVAGAERVVEEPAAVVDAREPIHHAVVRADYLQPEIVDPRIVAKEAMRTDVDLLAPAFDRPRETAHGIGCFEALDGRPRLAQLVGSRKACCTGADDGNAHETCSNVVREFNRYHQSLGQRSGKSKWPAQTASYGPVVS